MNENLRDQLVSILSNINFSDLDMAYNQEELKGIFNDAKKLREEKKKDKELSRLSKRKYRIDYTEIKATLGVPWISVDIIKDFVAHISNFKDAYIQYDANKGSWYLYKGEWVSSKYNTSRCTVLRMLEAMLNGRLITIKDSDGKIDESATIEVVEKQKLLEQEFEEWLWKDDYRRYKVMEAYNNMFDDYYQESKESVYFPQYDGLNPNIELYDYQKLAITKILSRKNSLIATEVGTGKTFMMIVSAMEMLNNGQSKKNMFVVPNNIVGQWENAFKFMYPNADVYVVGPQNFKTNNKKKVLEYIKSDECESIIIAYSCFDQLSVRKILTKNPVTESLNSGSEKGVFSTEDLRKECEIVYDFGELGVTALFVDEAHNYKNLEYQGNVPIVKGISNAHSKKCDLMLEKVRCVQGGGGKVVFATGTPLSNTLADAFTMQVYLQYEELVKLNLNIFSNWLKTFAQTDYVFEIDPTGSGFCYSKKIFRFVNLPELSKMFSKFTIFHTAEKGFIPNEINKVTFSIDAGEQFVDYMQEICDRVEKIKMAKIARVSEYRQKDNMLKICTDGRKAALDLKLVGRNQGYNSTSKIWTCVMSAMKIYRDFPDCSQIIFCDYSTPKNEKYNVYSELKERLISEGVKTKEIAFIHDYTNETDKLELFNKVNNAEVKILIGSTCKLGIGVNVQTKLKAIHHLDVPWRPADMVQREGRIVRAGNENNNIGIFRYALKGSFDAYFWQLLECKQTFISQFLIGKMAERSMSDLETDVLDYAEVKALALSNPAVKEYTMKLNELRLEEIVLLKNRERYDSLQNEIFSFENENLLLDKHISSTIENHEYIKHYSKEDLKNVAKNIVQSLSDNNYEIDYMTNIFDFDIRIVSLNNKQTKGLKMFRNGVFYDIELGASDTGNKIRLTHFLVDFKTQIDLLMDRKEKVTNKIKELIYERDSVDLSDEKILKLKEEVIALKSKI